MQQTCAFLSGFHIHSPSASCTGGIVLVYVGRAQSRRRKWLTVVVPDLNYTHKYTLKFERNYYTIPALLSQIS